MREDQDPLHDVWVVANKKTGKVMSAHCGCFAGKEIVGMFLII